MVFAIASGEFFKACSQPKRNQYHRVDASLPFFIPSPLIGTFGAVIRIKEPIRRKNQLLDVGAAGPLAGFFTAMQGCKDPFWLAPPGDNEALAQMLGAGDGVTTRFPLVRSFGPYREPVQGIASVRTIYVNGAATPASDYSVASGYAPTIVFITPPAPDVLKDAKAS